ncbi:MAG: sel1 repeat family protein, partial [Neisseriaceae bacterium]|nr:sel1 repeat family protein [Neisseriaceae bacterium]
NGVAKSCHHLGNAYFNGNGVKQNYTQAAKLYEKACNNDEAQSCFNLAYLYHEGKGVKQNKSTAKEYFQKSCNLGNQHACIIYEMKNPVFQIK